MATPPNPKHFVTSADILLREMTPDDLNLRQAIAMLSGDGKSLKLSLETSEDAKAEAYLSGEVQSMEFDRRLQALGLKVFAELGLKKTDIDEVYGETPKNKFGNTTLIEGTFFPGDKVSMVSKLVLAVPLNRLDPEKVSEIIRQVEAAKQLSKHKGSVIGRTLDMEIADDEGKSTLFYELLHARLKKLSDDGKITMDVDAIFPTPKEINEPYQSVRLYLQDISEADVSVLADLVQKTQKGIDDVKLRDQEERIADKPGMDKVPAAWKTLLEKFGLNVSEVDRQPRQLDYEVTLARPITRTQFDELSEKLHQAAGKTPCEPDRTYHIHCTPPVGMEIKPNARKAPPDNGEIYRMGSEMGSFFIDRTPRNAIEPMITSFTVQPVKITTKQKTTDPIRSTTPVGDELLQLLDAISAQEITPLTSQNKRTR